MIAVAGVGLGQVLREPVEHGLRAALELQVAIPSGGRAFDPLQLLLGRERDQRTDVVAILKGQL